MKTIQNTILLACALFTAVYGIGEWSEVRFGEMILEKQRIDIEESRHVWEICEKGGVFDDGEVKCKTERKIIYGYQTKAL